MNSEQWESSVDAAAMLRSLHTERPRFLRTQVRQIHRFLIACSWKHQHLIPQAGLRNGLVGAERWLAGEISNAELNRLNYYAEADAFHIDYATSPDQIASVQLLIDEVAELRDLPYHEARKELLDAAYFAEGAMIYSRFESLPWVDSLLTSRFLCADLLRAFIKPSFDTSATLEYARLAIRNFIVR